jgi:hypothetical protein
MTTLQSFCFYSGIVLAGSAVWFFASFMVCFCWAISRRWGKR